VAGFTHLLQQPEIDCLTCECSCGHFGARSLNSEMIISLLWERYVEVLISLLLRNPEVVGDRVSRESSNLGVCAQYSSQVKTVRARSVSLCWMLM
jgi:hypothetical protein